MNVWTLLMGICLTTGIAFGCMTGKPVGIVAFLIGLFVGAVAGSGGVCCMYLAGHKYDGWFFVKEKQPTKIAVLAYLVKIVFGLVWCFAIGLIAQGATRFLIHHILT